MIRLLRLPLIFVALLGVAVPPAMAFQPFVGTYVGTAELRDVATGEVEARDVETVIEPQGEGGFRIEWRSVVRRDGRRDVPGVRLVVRSLSFAPVDGGDYFLHAPDYDPFKVRSALEPMSGDALAWATVQDDVLHLFVFAVGDTGRAELQHHLRRLTEDGMALEYLGIVDGTVTTTGAGRMVRVD